VARIGGEEFALLLPDTEISGATAIACRLHDSIKLLGVVNEASPFNERLTVSIGIATTAPKAGMNPAALMDCADQALYMAKRQGRNRTCMRVMA
jgi:diguanylate cyclase (GGDEF)-like protein